MKENKLIIGGSGFLGSVLQKTFNKKNHNFYIGDSSLNKDEENYLDITKKDSFKYKSKTSLIINLAAEHRDDVLPISKYYEVNVSGSKNVCDFAEKNNINKIIFISSVAVYGFSRKPLKEDGDINYFNEYGKTKYLAEEVYKDWYQKDKEHRSLIIIRPTVIFGKGNRGNVYNLIKQIAEKKFLMIGDGKNIKSIAYVENVADFIEYLSTKYKSGFHLFNYSDKPDLDMNTLVSKIKLILFNDQKIGLKIPFFLGLILGYICDLVTKILKISLPISSIRVKKFISSTQFDSSAFSDGFKPSYTIEDALKETIESEFKI